MEQIKVGDKVRVRKDAPRDFIRAEAIPIAREFTVTAVERTYTEIKLSGALLPTYYYVPLKYLIKVEDEAKEPRFKVGDRVRIIGLHGRPIPDGDVDVIAHINIGNKKQMYFLENHYGCAYGFSESDLEPYTEPTEEKNENHLSETAKSEILSQKEPIADNNSDYWDAYTADLAKELALKVANKFNDPEVAAEYAVKVANAVAEGLKKK